MIFAALVCVMLSAACNISDPSEIHPSVEDGYGKISINFAIGENMAARTVLPSLVFANYKYTFTKAGETTGVEKIPGTDGSFLLELGSYTATVQAYTGTAESSPAASGVSSEFSVTAGENPSVQVALNAAGAATQGGVFTYTITYPREAYATAVITLQKWPNMDNITLSPTDITNGKTQTLSVETGSYLLKVSITETGTWHAGISEAVHIYPSLSTVYIKNFSDEDMIAE
jgi:hypothetical protein